MTLLVLVAERRRSQLTRYERLIQEVGGASSAALEAYGLGGYEAPPAETKEIQLSDLGAVDNPLTSLGGDVEL